MSRNIFPDDRNILCGNSVIVAGMKRKETLRQYIERLRLEQNPPWTYADIANQSRGAITSNYVGMMARGEVTNPTIDKIAALAAGLRRPEMEVYAVARGLELGEDDVLSGRVADLLNRARALSSKEDRQWFDSMMDMIDNELARRTVPAK